MNEMIPIIEKHLTDNLRQLAQMFECNCHYTRMLAKEIHKQNKNLHDMTVGELIELDDVCNKRYHELAKNEGQTTTAAGSNIKIVNNKVVNVEALKSALRNEFTAHNYHNIELDNAVGIYVRQQVEIPAAEAAGLDHAKADIYDVIVNVDELRDSMREITDELRNK